MFGPDLSCLARPNPGSFRFGLAARPNPKDPGFGPLDLKKSLEDLVPTDIHRVTAIIFTKHERSGPENHSKSPNSRDHCIFAVCPHSGRFWDGLASLPENWLHPPWWVSLRQGFGAGRIRSAPQAPLHGSDRPRNPNSAKPTTPGWPNLLQIRPNRPRTDLRSAKQQRSY